MSVLPLIYSLLFAQCQPALSRPVRDVTLALTEAGKNLTALRTEIAPGWAPSAEQRGTADVLWSCLVTLVACIFTAIHLNVPMFKDAPRKVLLRRISWALAALLSPELVLYMAFSQFKAARALRDDLIRIRKENGEREGEGAREIIRAWGKPQAYRRARGQYDYYDRTAEAGLESYNLAYSFYALMGGFVINVEAMHGRLSTATITDEGVRFLAKQNIYLVIPEDTMSTKSRAGIIGKLLIVVQVAWMVLQSTVRSVHGYPLTLLEVHTMVHVVCALILYAMWWSKPQGVTEPTVFDASKHPGLRVLIERMLIESETLKSGVKDEILLKYGNSESGEASTQPPSAPASSTDPSKSNVTQEAREILKQDSIPLGETTTMDQDDIAKPPFPPPQNPVLVPLPASPSASPNSDDPDNNNKSSTSVPPPPSDCLLEAVADINGEDLTILIKSINTMLVPRPGDFDKATALYICVPLSMVYGGIHLAAWNFQFPSTAERILWEFACFDIMGTFFAFVVLRSARFRLQPMFEATGTVLKAVGLALLIVDLVVEVILSLAFPFARVYLVLESFLSLRHVPIGVYSAVPWVQNIPHI